MNKKKFLKNLAIICLSALLIFNVKGVQNPAYPKGANGDKQRVL